MEQEKLLQLISAPLPLSQEALLEVRTWLKQYPYFQPLRVLLINQAIHTASDIEEVEVELHRQLPYITDKRAMLNYLKADCLGWNRWYDEGRPSPIEEEQNDVISLIDSFLNHSHLPVEEAVGNIGLSKIVKDNEPQQRNNEVPIRKSEQQQEAAVIDQYLSFDHHDLRHSFNSSEGKVPSGFTVSSVAQNEQDDDTLSESLAKIYVKQRKYQKAMELFQALMLKYPNKSVYFADQIRYLRIIIDNIKQN